jgi:L-fucose isomerase-like protein
MRKVKIGFIPSHRDPFSRKWGEKMRARCAAVLRKVPGLELVVPGADLTQQGMVANIEEGRKTLALFREKGVAGVIVGGMTFGSEVSAVGVVIAGMPKGTPVLHFGTKGAPITEDGLRASDSWCGMFMIASAMKRRGIKFEHIPTCFPEEPAFPEHVARFVRACAADQAFDGARIGQIGARPEEFESVWWDEASLQKSFNQTVVPVDLDETFARVDAIPADAKEVKAIVRQVTKGLGASDANPELLANMARYEIALEGLAREKELVAMGVNCWTRVQERFGVSVCESLGRLTDKGIMAACEVDIYGAATMWAAYTAGLDQVSPHFIDWTELHPERKNVWLAWHCGNCPRSLCEPNCQPSLRDHSIIQLRPACGTLEFRMKPGPVTCARMVEYDGKFTMFIGRGQVIPIEPFTRGSYGWVEVADVADWERKMIEHGIIHHGVLIHDPDVAAALESFCCFNDIEVVKGA